MYHDLNTYELLVMGITLHGFFLAGMMAVGQLVADHRSTKNILFFGLFLDFAFFELHTLLYQAQLLNHYILLNSLLVLAMYSLGPLFYLLVRFVLLDSFTLKAVHLSHFIPMSLAFISTMLALVYFPAKNTKIMPGFFYNSTHIYITAGGSISLLCYLVSIWKNIQTELIWKPDVIKKEPNEYRIAKARELLIQDKNVKVLAIALDVGFKSKSTFNAAFLKITGTPPSEYRKSN